MLILTTSVVWSLVKPRKAKVESLGARGSDAPYLEKAFQNEKFFIALMGGTVVLIGVAMIVLLTGFVGDRRRVGGFGNEFIWRNGRCAMPGARSPRRGGSRV